MNPSGLWMRAGAVGRYWAARYAGRMLAPWQEFRLNRIGRARIAEQEVRVRRHGRKVESLVQICEPDLLSVLIPARGAEAYIGDCLASILEQALPEGLRLEVLVGIDACERTREAVERYLAGIPRELAGRVRAIYYPDQLGVYVMQNSLVRASRGEWVHIVGADDALAPDTLGFICECARDSAKHSAAWIIQPLGTFCDSQLKPIQKKGLIRIKGAICVSKAAFHQLGGFAPWVCAADADFLCRAEVLGIPIQSPENVTYFHRLHDAQLSRSRHTGKSEIRARYWACTQQRMARGQLWEPPIVAGDRMGPERQEADRMRVVFVTNSTAMYGANCSLLNLIAGLKHRGVSSIVVAPRSISAGKGNLHAELSAMDVRSIPASIPPWYSTNMPPLPPVGRVEWFRWAWRMFNRLGMRLRHGLKRRLDVAGHLIQGVRSASAVAKELGPMGVDIVYSNSTGTAFGLLLAQRLGKPHVWHLREFGALHYHWRFDWGRAFSYWMIRRSAAVIAISNAIKEHYVGSHPAKACVVYNGVASQADFDFRGAEAMRVREGRNRFSTFLMVGLVHDQKGVPEALEALALLASERPGIRLMVAGGGKIQQMRTRAKELGVEGRVELMGHLADPFPAYLEADALLMCSRYEAMGRVTVEAWAARLPVIGLDQAGTAELIDHEQDGLLYRNGPAELASAMKRLVDQPAWARHLGDAGWRKARERFCIEAYARQIHQILERVMEA